MLAVIEAFAMIGVVVAIGAVAGRIGALGDNAREVLNRVGFHIGVPALLFLTLVDAEPAQVFSATMVVSAAVSLTVFGLYYLYATVLRSRTRGEATIGAWTASFVNAGNLGLPLSAYALGGTTAISAVILYQYVVLAPLGVTILSLGQSRHTPIAARIMRLLCTPMIAACILGLIVASADADLPALLRDPVELLAGLAIPTVLLAFGISLSAGSIRPGGENRLDLALTVLFKMALMPAAAYALARWGFGLDGPELAAVTVLAALPAGQNIAAQASVYGCAQTLARDSVLISTVLSVPVIVLIAALVGV